MRRNKTRSQVLRAVAQFVKSSATKDHEESRRLLALDFSFVYLGALGG
jgi:hypothetical protein